MEPPSYRWELNPTATRHAALDSETTQGYLLKDV